MLVMNMGEDKMTVRVYCYSEDNWPYIKVVHDRELFDRFEKYLNSERMVRYDYVVVENVDGANDDDYVIGLLDDFGF
jgi:hypothetical protein